MKKYKSVYIMESDEGLVKIGISNDCFRRKEEIEKIFGTNIKKIYFTPLCNCAFQIETSLHDYFYAEWVKGEFFSTTYNKAAEILGEIYSYYSLTKNFKEIDCFISNKHLPNGDPQNLE